MGLKVTNNAFGTLNASINSSATTIVLVAGQGARFPTLSAGDYFYATLIDTSNNLEIVKCTARSTDTLTVVRAQDSTTARAYATNDRFELRPTAVMLNEIITAAEAALPKAGGVMASGGRIQFQNSDGNTLYGIRATRYGYSSSYKSLQIGNGVASDNISLGVDVSAIAGGSFTGNGKDIVVPNSAMISMPNAANTDFTVPLQFSSGGLVTLPNNPHARVSKNNGNISGPSVVIFNFADEDSASMYSTSTGRFTAPVTGKYLSCHGLFSNSGSPAWVKWRVNGAVIATTYSNISSAYASVAGSMVLKLNAGDYLDIYVETGGYVVYGNDRTQCWATFTQIG